MNKATLIRHSSSRSVIERSSLETNSVTGVVGKFFASLFVVACVFVSAGAYAWTAEIIWNADREFAQPGEEINVSLRVRITYETGEANIGLAAVGVPIELNGISFVRVENPFFSTTVDLLDPRRPVISFSEAAGNVRGLSLKCTAAVGGSCDTDVFEVVTFAVSSTATGGSVASLQIVRATTSRQLEIQALTQNMPANVVAATPSAPVPLGTPLTINVVELAEESQLVLTPPVTPSVLGTVVSTSPMSAVPVFNVWLVDGDGAGNGDSFPSPIVTGFTMNADVPVDAFTFELRDRVSGDVIDSSVGQDTEVSFDGFTWQVQDGDSTQTFVVYAYKSGVNSNLTDGQDILFTLYSTPTMVVTQATSTLTSGLSGTVSDISFGIDVQPYRVGIAGEGDWDLTAPYALETSATDTDGNEDTDFSVSLPSLVFSVESGAQSSTITATNSLPITVYTEDLNLDRDGETFLIRVGLPVLGDPLTVIESEHMVSVDVAADGLLLASPTAATSLISAIPTTLTDLVVHAVHGDSSVRDIDENGMVGAADPSMNSLRCGDDDSDDGDFSCQSLGPVGSFASGIYSGPLGIVATLNDLSDSVTITSMQLFFGDKYGYFQLLDMGQTLSLTGCNGVGLTLAVGDSAESFFDVIVGGELCDGDADYDIYYVDINESGGSCAGVDVNALVSSATSAVPPQVTRASLSNSNPTARVTAAVNADTQYCVVVRVSGIDTASTDIVRVDTTVIASQVMITGNAVWDLTSPYGLSSTATDDQGRLDGDFNLSNPDVTVEAQVGGNAPWVAIDLVNVNYVATAAYTADIDRVPFALRARIGSGANSTLSVTVDVQAVALRADGNVIDEVADDGSSVNVTQAVSAVDANGVVDTDYSGMVVVVGASSSLSDTTATAIVVAGVISTGTATVVLNVSVEGDNAMNAPIITVMFTAESGGVRLMPAMLQFEFAPFADIDIDGNGNTRQLTDYAIMFAWAFNLNTYRAGTLAAGGDPTDPTNVNLTVAQQALGSPIAQGWLDPNIPIGEMRSLEEAVQKLVRLMPGVLGTDRAANSRFMAIDIDGNGVTNQLTDFAIMFTWAFNLNTYVTGTVAAGGDPKDPLGVNLTVAQQALGAAIAQGWLDSSIPTGERSLEEAAQKLIRIFANFIVVP